MVGWMKEQTGKDRNKKKGKKWIYRDRKKKKK